MGFIEVFTPVKDFLSKGTIEKKDDNDDDNDDPTKEVGTLVVSNSNSSSHSFLIISAHSVSSYLFGPFGIP